MLAHRPLDRQQLISHSILVDKARVFLLANLTEKLLEIVLDSATNDLLADFRLVPLLKALEMDQPAGSRALARRTQKLSRLFALAQHAILALQILTLLWNHPVYGDALVV